MSSWKQKITTAITTLTAVGLAFVIAACEWRGRQQGRVRCERNKRR